MAGIEDAFEKFADRLAREESKRYYKNEKGEYVEYSPEMQDPYPVKLGPLQLGANANMITGNFSPSPYDTVSTMNRNIGLRGKYNIPESGIALLGSIGDVRKSQDTRTDLPFNPMTGEASPYSEMRKNVYKESPYSIGAQYNPKGTDEMYSALYNKGGGYNLGYNKGPVNVSYTSNPGLGNNVMLRGQYNFAEGGPAGLVFNPGPYEGPYEGPYILGGPRPGQYYQSSPITSITGPDGAIPRPGMPMMSSPSTQTSQTDVSTNSIAKALEMAGFTKEEIMRILGQQGLANGGRVSMSDGGLTTTVPPAKGPDSQGVESLFRRRYS